MSANCRETGNVEGDQGGKMGKVTWLETERLQSRDELRDYMNDVFGIPSSDAGNLDAIADDLSEISEEVIVKVGREELRKMCDSGDSGLPYRVLRVLSAAADENPHLHFLIV